MEPQSDRSFTALCIAFSELMATNRTLRNEKLEPSTKWLFASKSLQTGIQAAFMALLSETTLEPAEIDNFLLRYQPVSTPEGSTQRDNVQSPGDLSMFAREVSKRKHPAITDQDWDNITRLAELLTMSPNLIAHRQPQAHGAVSLRDAPQLIHRVVDVLERLNPTNVPRTELGAHPSPDPPTARAILEELRDAADAAETALQAGSQLSQARSVSPGGAPDRLRPMQQPTINNHGSAGDTGRPASRLAKIARALAFFSAVMAFAAVLWSAEFLPFWLNQWLPTFPNAWLPYRTPMQTVLVFLVALFGFHALFMPLMDRRNLRLFRPIDYVWYLGAITSITLALIKLDVDSLENRRNQLLFEQTQAHRDAERITRSLHISLISEKNDLLEGRRAAVANLLSICDKILEKEEPLTNYCKFLVDGALIQACVFNPESGWHDPLADSRTEAIVAGFDIPEDSIVQIEHNDRILCSGVKHEIALSISAKGVRNLRLDWPLTRTKAAIPIMRLEEAAGHAWSTGGAENTTLEDLVFNFGRWSETIVGYSPSEVSDGPVSDVTGHFVLEMAPAWFLHARGIQQEAASLEYAERSANRLGREIDTFNRRLDDEAWLRSYSHYWYLILAVAAALRLVRTTAEVVADWTK